MKIKNISLALIVFTFLEDKERKVVHLNAGEEFENDNLTEQDIKMYVPKEIEILEQNEADVTKTDDATTTADDLTLVAGVGQATATKLLEAGINTFKALAELTEEQVATFKISADTLASAKTLAEQE